MKPAGFEEFAEMDGQMGGTGFLTERDAICAVGPIAGDPAYQGGVERQLMAAILERAGGLVGVRLVQEAFTTCSVALYALLGFGRAR